MYMKDKIDKMARMWISLGENSYEWAWLIWDIRDRIAEIEGDINLLKNQQAMQDKTES